MLIKFLQDIPIAYDGIHVTMEKKESEKSVDDKIADRIIASGRAIKVIKKAKEAKVVKATTKKVDKYEDKSVKKYENKKPSSKTRSKKSEEK